MSPSERPPIDERLVALIVALDRALETGNGPPSPDLEGAPPELRPRLERDLACMKLLRDVMRSGGPAEARLDRFRLLRELGRGAHGIVFLAYDPHLGREVALKVPRAEGLGTPELRQRFLQEARAVA